MSRLQFFDFSRSRLQLDLHVSSLVEREADIMGPMTDVPRAGCIFFASKRRWWGMRPPLMGRCNPS